MQIDPEPFDAIDDLHLTILAEMVAELVANERLPTMDRADAWRRELRRSGVRYVDQARSWSTYLMLRRIPERPVTRSRSLVTSFASRAWRYLDALGEGHPDTAVLDLLVLGAEVGRPGITALALSVLEAAGPVVREQVGPVAAARHEHVVAEWVASTSGPVGGAETLHRRIDPGLLALAPSVLAAVSADLLLSELGRQDVGDLAAGRWDSGVVRDPAYVNIGLDDTTLSRTEQARVVRPGQSVEMWVSIGPRDPDALPGPVPPVRSEHLEDDDLLEVVIFPDEVVGSSPLGSLGTFRVVATGPFPVASRVQADGAPPSTEHPSRLSARLTVPDRRGEARVRVGVLRRGVLLQMHQVTLPVGSVQPASVQVTYELARDLGPARGWTSLRTPNLTIYANAGEGTHDFSFYLPQTGGPAFTRVVHLEAARVDTLAEAARAQLRAASWWKPGVDLARETEATRELPGKPLFVAQHGPFAPSRPHAATIASALVDLAIAGRTLWQAFSESIEPGPDFRRAIRAALASPGAVQLAIKSAPDLVAPLQLIYDRKLDTADGASYLTLCPASTDWLAEPVDEVPCLTQACPGAGDDHVVCLAGFWGLRHSVSVSPPRRKGWDPAVPVAGTPPATLARATDNALDSFWTPHEQRLRALMDVGAGDPALTAADLWASLAAGRSVVGYVMAHVRYVAGVPRIVLDPRRERGALNATSLEDVDLAPGRPLMFLNACASAGIAPHRLLPLVNEFLDVGASGVVGTEIAVFADTAVAFAEAMLASYVTGHTLGESMRRARWHLLRLGNPLGFAYVCFGLHDLRLSPPTTPRVPAVAV